MKAERYSDAYDKGITRRGQRNEKDLFQQISDILSDVEIQSFIKNEDELRAEARRIANLPGVYSTPAKIIKAIESVSQGDENVYTFLLREVNATRRLLGLVAICLNDE